MIEKAASDVTAANINPLLAAKQTVDPILALIQ
jgi:hypothetical protein